jgi:hypothetical protein
VAFSWNALRDAIIDLSTETKHDSGQLAMAVEDLNLIVPPHLEMLADRVVNSTNLPGTDSNDRNAIKARRNISIIVNPLLTSSTAWFLLAKNKDLHGCKAYERVPITIEETDPDAVPPEGAQLVERDSHLDLDKASQPLHFLLTGTAWEGEEPGCYLVRGGEELIDDDELGYSSIRALLPEQISRLDEFLRELSHETLRQRFDYERMVALEIYSKPRARDKTDASATALTDPSSFSVAAVLSGERLVGLDQTGASLASSGDGSAGGRQQAGPSEVVQQPDFLWRR